VKVSDGTGVAEFVVLGKVAEHMVGVPAASKIAKEANPQHNLASPKMTAIIGKTLLFTVAFN
jgi:hypothetical protein